MNAHMAIRMTVATSSAWTLVNGRRRIEAVRLALTRLSSHRTQQGAVGSMRAAASVECLADRDELPDRAEGDDAQQSARIVDDQQATAWCALEIRKDAAEQFRRMDEPRQALHDRGNGRMRV